MYVLSPEDFGRCDLRSLTTFVSFWSGFWKPSVYLPDSKEEICYYSELNLSRNLTKQNIVRLLRWKYPRTLTDPLRSKQNEPNPRVQSVVNRIVQINRFRNTELTEDEFEEVTDAIFRDGIVFRAFLFHVARPLEWPIGDRYVFRAARKLFGLQEPTNLAEFRSYKDKFNELAETFRKKQGIDEADPHKKLKANKQLDNALMMYGKFLTNYDVSE